MYYLKFLFLVLALWKVHKNFTLNCTLLTTYDALQGVSKNVYTLTLKQSTMPRIREVLRDTEFYFQPDGVPPHYHRDV